MSNIRHVIYLSDSDSDSDVVIELLCPQDSTMMVAHPETSEIQPIDNWYSDCVASILLDCTGDMDSTDAIDTSTWPPVTEILNLLYHWAFLGDGVDDHDEVADEVVGGRYACDGCFGEGDWAGGPPPSPSSSSQWDSDEEDVNQT